MANITGLQFRVTLGDLPASTFAVVDFELREALNESFSLSINLASPQPGIDFGAVLDQTCELQVWYEGVLQRRISGIVSRFTQGDTGFRRTRYQAEVRPALWRTSLRTNARIFQAKKPDAIISTLLQEAGINDFAFALRHDHAEREYCVQYRESDLDFINRLAAEEGMYWFHEFEAGKHRVVFSDHPGTLEKGEPLFFNLASQGLAHGMYIRRFRYAEAVSTAGVELKDYSFKTPAYALSHKKISNALEHQREQYEHFDYPGRFKRDPSGKAFTGFRLDALRNDAATGQGESNCAALRPGYSFLLTEHPNPSLNIAWQIVEVVHEGKQPAALEEESGGEPTTLSNTFDTIAAKSTWRPQLPCKPIVDGPQIATVTGPAGEEIYCDQYGRVKVQFPWDRYGTRDDQSSCWVRVSQGWAGGQYGMMAIPRVGHEVVVSFLEGDPDQPIVTGRTFHATNLAPYPLPQHKTKTVLRSDTHQGDGFNELSFEDEAGKENIYIHAQKDIYLEANHNKSESIGNNHHMHIKNDAYITIDNEYRLLTKKDISLNSQTCFHIKSDSGIYALGNDEIHLSSGNKLVLDAGCELTIQAAGHFIKIDASGISTSAIVNMGSGSPGQGTGWRGKFPAELNSTPSSAPSITMPVESPPSVQKPLCLTCLMAAAENGQALVIRK